MHSTAFDPPEIDIAPFRELIRHLAELERHYPRRSVAHLTGTPSAAGPLATTLAVADVDRTRAMRDTARALGGSITDLLVSAATLAVADWNSSAGSPATLQRHAIAVNMRGRVARRPGDDSQNELSLVTVATKTNDWHDPKALVALTAERRRGYLDQGLDILTLRGATMAERALTHLPLRTRAFLAGKLLAPPHTLMVSNTGIPFPEVIDGKLTGRSMLQQVGEMVPVCSVGQGNTTPKTPNLLGLVGHEKGLMLTLSGNSANTTQAELDRIAGLVRSRLLELGSVAD